MVLAMVYHRVQSRLLPYFSVELRIPDNYSDAPLYARFYLLYLAEDADVGHSFFLRGGKTMIIDALSDPRATVRIWPPI